MARAKAAACVSSRRFQQGKNADLREAIRLLHEPIFGAESRVAITVARGRAAWGRIAERRYDVELQIGDGAIIDLDMRQRSRPAAGIMRPLRCDIDLPMVQFDRFRIVGDKWRPGERCE